MPVNVFSIAEGVTATEAGTSRICRMATSEDLLHEVFAPETRLVVDWTTSDILVQGGYPEPQIHVRAPQSRPAKLTALGAAAWRVEDPFWIYDDGIFHNPMSRRLCVRSRRFLRLWCLLCCWGRPGKYLFH